MKIKLSIFILLGFSFILAQQTSYKFDFGSERTADGYIPVSPQTIFNKKTGYGFYSNSNLQTIDRGGDAVTGDFITSKNPFYFAVALPEGIYDVKLIFGDKEGTSANTVRVENRRLMLENIKTQQGEILEKTITVYIKDSIIRNHNKDSIGFVKLKPREVNYLHWDQLLTIEFNDSLPKISAVEIKPNTSAKTIFLCGDSTVTDQPNEPYASWGQMIPAFFEPEKVVVANQAESGETLLAFESRKRIDKVWEQIKPGDFLLIQFGHNDQKPGGSHLDAFTTYEEKLKEWIRKTQQLGATPILVTSMNRREFDESGKIINSLADYAEAMREVAKEENIGLIDLNAMSKVLYEAWGKEKSMNAFIHVAANTYPNQPNEIHDDTHFSPFGAYELAKCIVTSIVAQKLPLAEFVVKDFHAFDPKHPDKLEDFYWPKSSFIDTLKPDGN